MEKVYGKGRDKFVVRPNPHPKGQYWDAGFKFIKVSVDSSGVPSKTSFLYLHVNHLPKGYVA